MRIIYIYVCKSYNKDDVKRNYDTLMAMVMLLVDIADFEEEDEELLQLRITRKRLSDELNVFNLPDIQFKNLFRVSKDLVRDLVTELRPHLQRERPNGLSVETQVLCAIRFYAVGSYQRAIGQDFALALSQTAVSRCIRSVSVAINDHMLCRWIKFPATPEQREAAKIKFANAPQPFPGAIGAIDCTHVGIVAPKENEEAFVNHHGYHSMNVQMICDPELRILNVSARFPGSRHDAAIWMQSPVRNLMELCHRQGERQTWLLDDSGYPLEPWLLTPIPNAPNGSPEYIYIPLHIVVPAQL
nr:putative nuclease HARBI1 isoform X1 [Neodiprion pinetum]